jgi:hypothetical protein
MRIVVTIALLVAAVGCGTTSYGVTTDGTFPPRPGGAVYPNWEHNCVVIKKATASEELNAAGAKGWELAGMTPLKDTTLMCFKREKPAG